MIVTSDFRQVAQGNVDLLNEMLTELVPDQVPFIIIARVISVLLIFTVPDQAPISITVLGNTSSFLKALSSSTFHNHCQGHQCHSYFNLFSVGAS